MMYRTAPFSMTLNDTYPGFKVTPFFDAEYLINGTTYRHSFNEILIRTYTRPTQQCHFEWSWVTLSDLAKYSMTRSARGVSALLVFVSAHCVEVNQVHAEHCSNNCVVHQLPAQTWQPLRQVQLPQRQQLPRQVRVQRRQHQQRRWPQRVRQSSFYTAILLCSTAYVFRRKFCGLRFEERPERKLEVVVVATLSTTL